MIHFQIPQDLFHEEGYKQVNNIPHFYRIVGSGEPFVFLHGGPGMWHDELVPSFFEFARTHQCIFYDQRGNGKSLMEESIDETNFTTDLLMEDLELLRREFGLEKMNIIGPAREMKLNITVQERLGNIACPTLIVQGQEDFIPPESAKLAHKLIRNSKLVYIANSGHYPFMEAPSDFFNTLNSFIDET